MKYLLLVFVCLLSAFAASFIQLDATRQSLNTQENYTQSVRQQAAHRLGARLVANLVDGEDTQAPFPPDFIKGLHSNSPQCVPALSAIYRIEDSQGIFFAYGCLARILLERDAADSATQQAI